MRQILRKAMPGKKAEKTRITRKEAILGMLFMFLRKDREEVSLPEIQECVAQWQQTFPLGYQFSQRFLYSLDLFKDLTTLEYKGLIKQYTYRHDSLLPKHFLALTVLGRGYGDKALSALDEDETRTLESAVSLAMENYKQTWRLLGR